MEQQDFIFKEIEKGREKLETKDRGQPKIYTVSEIVGGARHLLEGNYGDVWVLGEISGYKHHSSGHRYFTLKDGAAILPAALFRGAANGIKFAIEDGLEVICHGRLSLYQRGGQYQIIVDYLEPKGIGDLQLAFEQLKKKLKGEGLFDDAHKKPIPTLPRKIGIVTSPTGAAIRDMLKILRRRFSNIDILIAPARVQGEGSAAEIAGAITLLNTYDDIDVMIVGRGGGSIEDLWAFNEEVVARAIFHSRIPVISAVGHEVDFTIADFVADLRAPTPSGAAELVIPVKEELHLRLLELKRQLCLELRQMTQEKGKRVKDLAARLIPPTRRFPDYYRYLDNIKERMIYSIQVYVNKVENVFKSLASQLRQLSPLAVLKKGYAVVTEKEGGRSVKDVKDIKIGDSLGIRFAKGSVLARVIKKF